ncbi:MAG: LacI family DNA-binding transcriptional regulator [Bacteroidota bacterium]
MGKLSIDEVAKLAYVSRSVVSRVLNDHPNVSDEARERVMEVVEKYNYRPSSVARGLATNQSYEIGILAPRRCDEALANGFWSLLHLGIFEECIQQGYFVSMSPISNELEADIEEYVLDNRRLDGFILLTQEVTDVFANKLVERDTPLVLVGHAPENPDLISIDVDNFDGGYKATRHLIELGHEKIGIILADLEMQESSDRLAGYKKAHEDAGLSVDNDLISIGDYSQQHGYESIENWIQKNTDLSAVFCTSDTLAMGTLSLLHKESVSVPDDMAIVGFDDLPIAQYTTPTLTTVKQPIVEKGERAAQLLIKQIENDEQQVLHENLEPELIIRESCGAI